MVVISRIFSRTGTGYGKLQAARILHNATRKNSSTATSELSVESHVEAPKENIKRNTSFSDRYRFIYPEFLPEPDTKYRNPLREKLERMDMLARRAHIVIPEFYIGSILAATYSEPHAPGKVNRFVGICIQRVGTGLRSMFILRNVVDNQGVEVSFNVYDPVLHKIECLRLEKRMDPHLRYLRDAPLEHSTFPFDMEPEYLPEGTPVPVNKTVIELYDRRLWTEKWEIQELKGIANTYTLTKNRARKAKANEKPWEKYDLMKTYRETIPLEEQDEIFSEVYEKLRKLEISQYKQRHKRTFVRPKKTG
ncbi:39S ribosomal protein L19, mitochondrial [Pseudomyrmex gracilis]|uniref:39S ribosomal protein L19, mitochondrial n=1 Tax=Pseudomyrmex gracilis TaxID=219809 RepID=UPI000995D08D|nr:39S ribosomal protein L19, mitochondrial [Pseudomyrmex gracilis]